MQTQLPPSPFLDQGKRSTFDELVADAKSILEEIELPKFIADPSDEFTEMLMELAA